MFTATEVKTVCDLVEKKLRNYSYRNFKGHEADFVYKYVARIMFLNGLEPDIHVDEKFRELSSYKVHSVFKHWIRPARIKVSLEAIAADIQPQYTQDFMNDMKSVMYDKFDFDLVNDSLEAAFRGTTSTQFQREDVLLSSVLERLSCDFLGNPVVPQGAVYSGKIPLFTIIEVPLLEKNVAAPDLLDAFEGAALMGVTLAQGNKATE